MILLLSLLLSVGPLFAQDTDRNLAQYIQLTNMKPLPSAPVKREALYQLGLRLFYDKQLSGKENISCHACHSLSGHSTDTLPLAVGEGAEGLASGRIQSQGALVARHTPALYNLGLPGVGSLFWDGRVSFHPSGGWLTPEEGFNGPNPLYAEVAKTFDSLLAVQAIFPLTSPEEMLGQGSALTRVEAWQGVLHRIFNGRLGASYRMLFRNAFPNASTFNIGHVGNALAELERHHFLANNTPWDRYLRGEKKIMSERMKRGALVFMNKGSCTNCHSGEHLTSFGFQNVGIPQIGPGVNNGDDLGRFDYRFRVAPLRNVGLTAPYMHTGAFSTIWEVIDHYDHPMRSLHQFSWNPKHPRYREDLIHDNRISTNNARQRTLASNLPRFLDLTPDEKKDLYCFLMVGLTDLKLQPDLLSKGVLDEIDDCSPLVKSNSRSF